MSNYLSVTHIKWMSQTIIKHIYINLWYPTRKMIYHFLILFRIICPCNWIRFNHCSYWMFGVNDSLPLCKELSWRRKWFCINLHFKNLNQNEKTIKRICITEMSKSISEIYFVYYCICRMQQPLLGFCQHTVINMGTNRVGQWMAIAPMSLKHAP